MSKARRTPLTGQRALRKAADEALERAIEDGRLAYRTTIQDDLVDEPLAIEKDHRKAERSMTGAAIVYERAVAHAETTMRRELHGHPEAHLAQQAHDRQDLPDLTSVRARQRSGVP